MISAFRLDRLDDNSSNCFTAFVVPIKKLFNFRQTATIFFLILAHKLFQGILQLQNNE